MAKILVVDDALTDRALAGGLLKKSFDCDIFEAPDGEAALAQIEQEPPDLVLTDLIMPGQEGVETILELRKEFPEVRIIAMSGGGRSEPGSFLGFANKLGATDTLEKPFSRDKLLDTIAKVLN